MKYCIMTYTVLPLLVKRVNKMLEAGWRLQGGVTVDHSDSNTYYYQAMVKEDDSI